MISPPSIALRAAGIFECSLSRIAPRRNTEEREMARLEVLRLHFFVDLDPEPESHAKEPELESCGSGSKVDPDPHPDPDPFLDLDLPQM